MTPGDFYVNTAQECSKPTRHAWLVALILVSTINSLTSIFCHLGTAIKHPVPDRVKPSVNCNFWHLGTLTLRAERQSARVSKITNNGLIRSGTRCFNSCTRMATVSAKGLTNNKNMCSPRFYTVRRRGPFSLVLQNQIAAASTPSWNKKPSYR